MSNIEPIEQGHSLSSDQFLKRYVVAYVTKPGEGEKFVETKRSTRDAKYGFFASATVRTGSGFGRPMTDKVLVTYEDLSSKDLPLFRHLCRVATIPLPLERHPDYVCIWNHHVTLGKDTTMTTDLVYSEWKDLADLADAGTTGAPEKGKWQKANQALSKSEVIAKVSTQSFAAVKPGEQSFLVPAPEVTQIVYSRLTSTVETYIQSVGKLASPTNKFGLTLDPDAKKGPLGEAAKGWLVMGTDVRRINDWYEITVQFKFFKYGWDQELYEVQPT